VFVRLFDADTGIDNARDRRGVGSRFGADRFPAAAQQADRRRETAFAHEAGIHQDGMLKDAATYQDHRPGRGRRQDDAAARQAFGRHAFARACAEARLSLSREELADAFVRSRLADLGVPVNLDDVFQEVRA